MTTAIYARYSTDMQSERSIDDQVVACKEFARRRGIDGPFDVYADRALSGASMATRPDMQALLQAVRARRVTAIISEAIDRLSRDQADLHMIRRAATANNVKLFTIADGEVTGMVAGLQGIMAEAFLVNLAQKTRRGMMGVARQGKIAGGLSYGYRVVAGKPGEREIDETEAEVVRRIFADYVGGRSPFAIARELNSAKTPGPRGALWKVPAILGNPRNGDGVLCNELYRGRVVFNRRRFVKDPETGRRSGFLNPPSEWSIVERPDLRIIDDETFEAAERVRASMRTLANERQNKSKRPQRLLSGLLVCGHCQGNLTIRNRDRYACANVINGTGLCDSRESLPAEIVERRVIEGLKRHLLAPEIIEEAVRDYLDEEKAMHAEKMRARHEAERALAEAKRRGSRIADQFIDTPSPLLRTKMLEADAAIAAAEAELAAIPEPSVVAMHPNTAAAYKAKVAAMEAALAADARCEIRNEVRSLMTRVEVAQASDQPDGWSVVIVGQLAALLALGAGEDPRRVRNEKAPSLSTGGSSLATEVREPSPVGGALPTGDGLPVGRVMLGAGAYTRHNPTEVRMAA